MRGSSATGELAADERRDVVAGAARLMRGLTGERELAGARYFDDTQLLGAYLLLYWPVSYAQARVVLNELHAPLGDVLDLGSGPGPLALAALDAGATAARAIDRVPAALAIAKSLAADARRTLAVEAWDPSRPLPGGPFDTILAGHVINELYGGDLERRAALALQLLARLRPGGALVIIEPALRETSRALLQLRDRLVAQGVSVRAPCLFRGDCPALVRPTDWCHAEQPWTAPPLVEALAQAAKLHRDSLKMTYVILQPPSAGWPDLPPGRLFRIVSEPLPEKGKQRFVGCGPEGRFPLVLPDKHVRDNNRAFVDLQRGDLVRIERLATRGDGLRLDDQSDVDIVTSRAHRNQ
ncbi:MAG TPA: small ribosomal subunit Rsm22 family protein [Polyangia bacterium]|nr:small ribosomal subunit Rsm22 family protein [Polyangia bacterium]